MATGAATAQEAASPQVQRGRFDVTRTPAELIDAETLESAADVLDADEDVTWISADNSGNKVATKRRMLFAVVAPIIVAERYRIDPGLQPL